MRNTKDVIRIEMVDSLTEEVTKTRRQEFKSGGFRLTETIVRVTQSSPTAILECGHSYTPGPSVNILDAKRLECWDCRSSNVETSGESS